MALFRSALLTSVTIASAFATVAIANAAPAAASHAPAALPAAPAVVPAPVPVRAKPVVHKAAPKPKPTPKPTPTATRKATPKATATATPKPTATATATHKASTSLTPQQRMMRAVAAIPGYRTGDAEWIMRQQANWGLALMGGGTVYIDPDVPANRMYDVVAHEWSHLLSVRDYANDVQTALDAMNAFYGGSGLTGAERAADCMAKLLGAEWTHYTSCTNTRWIAGAKRLIAGQKL